MNIYKIRVSGHSGSDGYTTYTSVLRPTIGDAVAAAAEAVRLGTWKNPRNVEISFDSTVAEL